MQIVTGSQMKEIDKAAIKDYKIPGVKLMETAGSYVYEEVIKTFNGKKDKSVIIICGAGNNGGDGYVVARKLHCDFIEVKVYSTVDVNKLTGDAKINYEKFIELGEEVCDLNNISILEKFKKDINNSYIIIDAILGTGISREVSGNIANIINIINSAKKNIISVDIPSGTSANDGKIYGVSIRANKTIAFQLPKIGNIFYPGAEYGGKLIVKDIGIPQKIINDNKDINISLIDEEYIKAIILKREKDTHKGTYGKAVVIAGSKGMAGAAVLTSKSALRSGIGLIKVAVPESINNIIQISVSEAITIPIPDNNRGSIGIEDIPYILENISDSDIVAIGPGCGRTDEIGYTIENILKNTDNSMVIDADGLNALSNRMELLDDKNNTLIISPHPGEMSRLTGLDIEYINENRIEVASTFAKEKKVIVVLKGARTVVAEPSGKIYINITGNPGMSTAGSGDVLTGIITSFIAQGLSAEEAAVAGVYIHGLAGDIMAKKVGEYGLVASDIVKGIPLAIKEIVE